MNLIFPELPSPKMHPANIGHDLVRCDGFDDRLRQLYLDRVLKLTMFDGDFKKAMADLHTVFNTGAKIVLHATAPKTAGDWDAQRLNFTRFYIGLARSLDPELIFDAYITDRISPTIRYIAIPAFIFEAFGLQPEDRCFDPAGGELEQKMWYYFRATQFLDAGFESISLAPGISQDVADMIAQKAVLVFREEPVCADLKVDDEETIKNRWITQKQREHG